MRVGDYILNQPCCQCSNQKRLSDRLGHSKYFSNNSYCYIASAETKRDWRFMVTCMGGRYHQKYNACGMNRHKVK